MCMHGEGKKGVAKDAMGVEKELKGPLSPPPACICVCVRVSRIVVVVLCG